MTLSYSETKTCTRCGRHLPRERFGKVRKDRSWLRAKCNECEAARRRDARKGKTNG